MGSGALPLPSTAGGKRCGMRGSTLVGTSSGELVVAVSELRARPTCAGEPAQPGEPAVSGGVHEGGDHDATSASMLSRHRCTVVRPTSISYCSHSRTLMVWDE